MPVSSSQFILSILLVFGKHKKDTCCVTSTSLGAGTLAVNKGPKEPS